MRAAWPILLAGAAFASRAAAAENAVPSGGPVPEPPGEKRVRFHSRKVEFDTARDHLELSGDVVVVVERYRLTSDHLVLERTPRGVRVDGSGRVAFCACGSPPITLGFQSALVAPPTDLLLEEPTLRVFGVPVFWLPYLWLRSPARPGLLPLRLGWLGEDGPLAGSGVHLPVGDDRLDLSAAGYLRGGFDVGVRYTSPKTTSSVRWDHLRESLVAVDLRGAQGERGGSVAWSADALRGERALSGPVTLEEASLRQDRVRVVVGSSDGVTTAGVVVSADARRGGAFTAGAAAGPGVHVGVGGPMGSIGTADAAMDAVTLGLPGGSAATLLSHHGEVRADGHAGPVALGVEARSRADAQVTEEVLTHTAAAGVAADASLPFVKRFGDEVSPTEHWVAPFVGGTAGVADAARPVAVPALVPDGVFYAGGGGLRSTLGGLASSRGAATVRVGSNVVGEKGDAPYPVFVAALGASARLVAARSEAVITTSGPFGALAIGDVRLGEGRAFVGGRVSGLHGDVPLAARLVTGSWDAPWVPWFDPERVGWTVGGRAGVVLLSWLTARAQVEYDASEVDWTWLGGEGALEYRHPCRCLAVAVWGGNRLGRRGVDSWLSVDLMP